MKDDHRNFLEQCFDLEKIIKVHIQEIHPKVIATVFGELLGEIIAGQKNPKKALEEWLRIFQSLTNKKIAEKK